LITLAVDASGLLETMWWSPVSLLKPSRSVLNSTLVWRWSGRIGWRHARQCPPARRRGQADRQLQRWFPRTAWPPADRSSEMTGEDHAQRSHSLD
jgi:hypothetical protein